MNVQQSILDSLNTADMVCMAYLNDFSDEDLMVRPHPDCHHVNWQVGHLIASEHEMMSRYGEMPPLPAGFKEKYSKEAAASDNPADFASKAELLAAYQTQRAASVAAIKACPDASLEQETGVEYAPTVASLFAMQSSHWLMHCGQWVIVRRATHKPVVI